MSSFVWIESVAVPWAAVVLAIAVIARFLEEVWHTASLPSVGDAELAPEVQNWLDAQLRAHAAKWMREPVPAALRNPGDPDWNCLEAWALTHDGHQPAPWEFDGCGTCAMCKVHAARIAMEAKAK